MLDIYSKPVESLALGYLASAARAAGHEAVMVDGMAFGYSAEVTAERILAELPDAVGLTNVLNYFPPEIPRIARLLREGGFEGPIFVGGHSTSFMPEEILVAHADIDAVLVGEGEPSIPRLLEALNEPDAWRTIPGVFCRVGGAISGTRPDRVTDLDAIPPPARDLTQAILDREGLIAISTSRGCYARCSFCSVPRFFGLSKGGKMRSGEWLGRSIDGVVREVLDLHQRFGIRELLVVDDEFFGGSAEGTERARGLGKALELAGRPVEFAISCRAESVDEAVFEQLARGGLRHVFVGLESGSPSALQLYGKAHTVEQNRRAVEIVKRLGLSFQPGYMLFNHRSSLVEVKRSLEFLRSIGECKPATFNTSVDPHFGAPLVTTMDRDGVLRLVEGRLQSGYLDPRVGLARAAAELCGVAFQPFMNLVAALQSSVTFEWRRRIPGRRPENQALLDQFEARINDEFTRVLEGAISTLEASAGPLNEHAFLESVRAELSALVERLQVAQAIIMVRLSQTESLTYWTQTALIKREKAAPLEQQ